uniref:Piwi domain-containing protein n=1 Tax=Caenorhabditis japonica TaxID=281687 RepID=A0A8R1DRE7_CAEJA
MTTKENPEISEEVGKLSVKENEKRKLGLLPLAEKKPRNTSGKPVQIATNIRRLVITPNKPIYKYAVKVLYVFRTAENTEARVEMSKSARSGTEHENDKVRCQKVYKKAVERYDDLKKGGPFFYDRQACMYSLSKLKVDNISFNVTEDVCKRRNFIRAEFELCKVEDSFQSTSNDVKKTVNRCPGLADRTLIEALNVIVSGPAFENKNVITVGACVHYLIDPSQIEVPYKEYQEGGLYSGVGASKAVKTSEGTGKEPSLFMSTEMKSTLFHPDYVPLVELFKTYKGFSTDLKANSPAALRIAKAFVGIDVNLDYGPHKGLLEDSVVMKIRGFSTSATDTFFLREDKKISVKDYFKSQYGITLKYPNLFTIEAKGKVGKVFLPAEVLTICPSQTVTNDQMINNEQADMIKIAAAPPHLRKRTTDAVVKNVGLASNNIYGFIKVEEPLKVEGIVLEKPKILYAQNRAADLNNPKARFPTDWNIAGQYFIAKSLQNWEICYIQGDEIGGLDEQLYREMAKNGMKVSKPVITYIVRGDLKAVFEKAKKAGRELVFFVIKQRYNLHQEIKALEQKYDLLTQEIKYETAEKVFRQAQTRLNIVNKTNMKLGGLNYQIGSNSFKNPGRLIIGFETSQRGGGGGDMPIAVGFAANMLDHFQKFAGGYVYVKRDRDIYGPIVQSTLQKILQTVKKNRGAPSDILIYFNGVTEGQYALINEEFSASVKTACQKMHESFKPNITIIASSKTHNERLYQLEKNGIANLEPGSVIDHTIVSPVYNEWYHASSVARQGTTKTTKFTLIYTTIPNEPMSNLETLTNDLCYDHQIVFHPVGLPVPLFIAGRYSQRGAAVLSFNGAEYKDGEIDLEATNAKLGYGNKKLFETRFNA